jgi:hypothetical protein
MNQALYAHMNNKRKMKKKSLIEIVTMNAPQLELSLMNAPPSNEYFLIKILYKKRKIRAGLPCPWAMVGIKVYPRSTLYVRFTCV